MTPAYAQSWEEWDVSGDAESASVEPTPPPFGHDFGPAQTWALFGGCFLASAIAMWVCRKLGVL